ncbi:MAG: primary-amine oxidase [Blastocatellia bacterium]|nr:primary-amine oxidase [Blastocatellia bacterium]
MRAIRFVKTGLVAVVLSCLFSPPIVAQSDFAHPLDPLSKDEITTVVETLKTDNKATDSSRFSTLVLHEPPKAEVLNYKPGAAFRREAFVVVFERAANQTHEAIVDVKNKRVLSWKEIKGVQPSFMQEDFLLVMSVVRGDPAFQAAMQKRGITDYNNVQLDGWSAGWFGFSDEANIRVSRAIPFYRGKGKNAYPHPIEGVIAYVDLTNKKVLKVEDTGVVPVPAANAELDPESNAPLRTAPKPLQIVQPDGVSFELRGNEVRWQNWRFRYALHPREGLVLYTVGYEDQGKLRSILYRGSLSEMVVPYGDPSAGWFIRNAFDEGEYGVGALAVPLEANTDVPDNAILMSAMLATERGNPQTRNRAVALYERDGGVLWKHVDYLTNRNESRRARQLVLSSFANVGNYEYGFNWVFHQDGTLEMEVLLTGVMSVKGVVAKAEGEHPNHSNYGHLVAPGIEAVHHQHFFNFRLDFDVDGAGTNSVVEQNTMALPAGKNNPHNNAFAMHETVFKREAEAQRQLNLASARRWKIINPQVKNSLGQPTGYLLVTGENSVTYSGLNSFVRKRAGFMNHHLWVTPHVPDEMNSAGFYVNQSRGGDGLPKWTKGNRAIENQDVVLWYSMGVTHIPRPEDWPVMPVHKAGFKLMPAGFFARNPAMDMPK